MLTGFFSSDDQPFKHKTLGFHLGIFLGNSYTKINVPKDKDHDGVLDDVDQCPEMPGSALTKGCPDKDGDGIPDKDDNCPNVAGTTQYKGCPVPDKDNDGIADDKDKCPDVAGERRYDGCPVPDSDKDGVNDEEDKCPTVVGPKDNHGCPKVSEEQQQKISYAAKQIQFEYKKADISATSFSVLDEVVDFLKTNPTFNIRVEGHSSGPESESNLILSEKRAESVRDYFIKKGVAASRIAAQGFGSSRHISKDGGTKDNPEDRRVELIVF
jgi:OmpA-OmpF porin, OOP family